LSKEADNPCSRGKQSVKERGDGQYKTKPIRRVHR
jgi:hypothetical protein